MSRSEVIAPFASIKVHLFHYTKLRPPHISALKFVWLHTQQLSHLNKRIPKFLHVVVHHLRKEPRLFDSDGERLAL